MTPSEPKTQLEKIAEAMFDQLDYFAEYLPVVYGLRRVDYESRTEGRRTIDLLRQFTELTGIKRQYPLNGKEIAP